MIGDHGLTFATSVRWGHVDEYFNQLFSGVLFSRPPGPCMCVCPL